MKIWEYIVDLNDHSKNKTVTIDAGGNLFLDGDPVFSKNKTIATIHHNIQFALSHTKIKSIYDLPKKYKGLFSATSPIDVLDIEQAFGFKITNSRLWDIYWLSYAYLWREHLVRYLSRNYNRLKWRRKKIPGFFTCTWPMMR